MCFVVYITIIYLESFCITNTTTTAKFYYCYKTTNKYKYKFSIMYYKCSSWFSIMAIKNKKIAYFIRCGIVFFFFTLKAFLHSMLQINCCKKPNNNKKKAASLWIPNELYLLSKLISIAISQFLPFCASFLKCLQNF